MFSSNSIKVFFVFALGVFSSCGWWRAAKSEDAPVSSSAEELKSSVPFVTKEPENFQAEFVVTANDSDNKIFVARSGNRRRSDYNSGAPNQLTVLQQSANQTFLILPYKKIYAENSVSQTAAPTEDFKDFLTNEWLNQTAAAKFTRLGSENDLTKYAVRLNDSDAAETIVFVDERINLPVRQEFYARRGEQKVLTYAVEMKNFKTPADENLFEIPKDVRKVSIEILRATMREIKTDGK